MHPRDSSQSVLLLKWLDDLRPEMCAAMIGSASLTDSDWTVLAFNSMPLEEQKKDPKKKVAVWSFSVIAEVLERQWIVWILKRMRGAMEDKVRKSYSG